MAGLIQDGLAVGLESVIFGTNIVGLNKAIDGLESVLQTRLGGLFKEFDFGVFRPLNSIEYWDEIYGSVYNTNQQLGITYDLGQSITTQSRNALLGVASIGGEIGDITKANAQFIETFGRNVILSAKALENIVTLEKAFGKDINNLVTSSYLMGRSVEDTYNFVSDIVEEANRMGLNASVLIGELNDNIGLLDSYNFRAGIRGLTKMVKLAQKTKISIETATNLADNLFDPEQALELSSSLQMLGGQFASLGDPFELLFKARNAPEELMQDIVALSEGMATLNRETGEIEVNALSRSAFRELEKITSGAIKATEMVQASRLSFIQGLTEDIINQSQLTKINDDVLSLLANVATINKTTGKLQFDIGGNFMDIEDITDDAIKRLNNFNAASDDPIKQLILTNESISEQMRRFSKVIETFSPESLYQQIKTNVADPFGELTNDIVSGVSGAGAEIVSMFQTIDTNVMKELTARFDLLNSIGSNVGGIEGVVSKMASLVESTSILLHGLDDVFFGNKMRELVKIFESDGTILSKIGDSLYAILIQPIVDVLTAIGNKLVEAISAGFESLGNRIESSLPTWMSGNIFGSLNNDIEQSKGLSLSEDAIQNINNLNTINNNSVIKKENLLDIQKEKLNKQSKLLNNETIGFNNKVEQSENKMIIEFKNPLGVEGLGSLDQLSFSEKEKSRLKDALISYIEDYMTSGDRSRSPKFNPSLIG